MALTRGGFRHYDFDLMVVLLTMTNAATEVGIRDQLLCLP
jgi:hypothetical protein